MRTVRSRPPSSRSKTGSVLTLNQATGPWNLKGGSIVGGTVNLNDGVRLGVLAGHPLAFLLVIAYGVAWVLQSRDSFGWHGFAVLSTWFMTLLIQRAEYRDTQAIQAKLDELLHAQSRARDGLAHIDEEEPEDIERHRALARRDDKP